MKKMNLIFAMLATVCCGHGVAGSMRPEGKVAILKVGEIVKVIYEGHAEATVRLTILDSDGQEVFAEKVISHEGFVRPYNLSKLPEGDYRILVADEGGEQSERVHIGKRAIQVGEENWVARVTKVKGEECKYLVVIPHQAEHEVGVHIYDRYQQLVFSKKHQVKGDFAVIYNLKNLQGGTIHLVNQSSGEERFFQTE